ncbi:MAG: hypothetical protein ABSD74_09700 [Rhizomicrobium sp.]|jgi:hypothetical protein
MALPKTNGVDAYVVVIPQVKRHGSIAVGHMNPWGLTGEHASVMLDETTHFIPYYVVGVIDAKSGKKIDDGKAVFRRSLFSRSGNPFKEKCSNDLWATSAEQLTADQKTSIHRQLASLLSRTVAYALADANLISADDAAAETAQIALPADPSCH